MRASGAGSPGAGLRRAARGLGLVLAFLVGTSTVLAADRLDEIKDRGYLVCAVPPDRHGFGVVSADKSADGLDADLCRGIAAAIFGPGDHVRFEVATTSKDFLGSGADIAFDELTWTLSRELNSGLSFGPVYFFDGQAFLARNTQGVASARQMGRASVCVEANGHFLDSLIAFIDGQAPELNIALTGSRAEVEAAFFAGECDLLSGDASELYSAARSRATGSYVVLTDRISKEPLAPVARRGDWRLIALLRWSIFATIEAEELGITEANVDARTDWYRISPSDAAALRLAPEWPRDVIKAAGNYGEIYDRNLSQSTAVTMTRGLNELWTHGGLLYSPPLQ